MEKNHIFAYFNSIVQTLDYIKNTQNYNILFITPSVLQGKNVAGKNTWELILGGTSNTL